MAASVCSVQSRLLLLPTIVVAIVCVLSSFHWSREEVRARPRRLQSLQGCGHRVEGDTRVLLLPLVPSFHGSTALQAVLMSSRMVSTQCSARVWQYEGSRAMPKGSPMNNCTERLRVYSAFWDLSKPVLLDKHTWHWMQAEDTYACFAQAALPSVMREAGVRKLQPVLLMMWRPPCLRSLGAHAPKALRKESTSYGVPGHRSDLEEALVYDSFVLAHRYFTEQGVPALLLNYADLLWRGDYVERRIGEFLPCLGSISVDYVPKLGVDVFLENDWKVKGSVRSYGARLDPQACCEYNVSKSTCMGPRAGWLSEQARGLYARRALLYLRNHS
uniref:Uncharacterized protein n=1 Tax=Pyrodinium bahamense TaxID=73915 RepID=A0A7S0B9C9_9DINO